MKAALQARDEGAEEEEGLLEVRYTPDVEGQDFGTLVLTSNDPVAPVLTLELEGMGVLPRIDVVRYSTTVAMNRLIERRGPRVGHGDRPRRPLSVPGRAQSFSL